MPVTPIDEQIKRARDVASGLGSSWRARLGAWRPRRSHIWAGLFLALIGGWILSGDIVVGGRGDSAIETAVRVETNKGDTGRFAVRVRTFTAESREAFAVIRGRTEADARVEIQAETTGVVEALPVAKGALVNKGDVLCRLEPAARQATVRQNIAAVEQAQLDYNATQNLAKRGHTATLKVAEYRAKLDAARAALEKAELDLGRINVGAPFEGIVEDQPAKVGDHLQIGETCAKLVALDPLIVVGTISERQVSELEEGMTGTAALVTGETVTGRLRYIAPAADPKTRTFRFELEVANPDLKLRDGVTAEIKIPLKSGTAHKFSPAILTLDDSGEVGVRVIENGDTARFMPVRILDDDKEGVWVSGLPETVTVITVGQDFVTDGQKVKPVPETPDNRAVKGLASR